MAFFAMVLATGFLIIVGIGLFILLIGVILDIVWGVRKKKDKKVPVVLKVFAVILTILGSLQGVVPLLFVAGMSIKSKIDYKAEVSSLPQENVIYMDYDNGFENGFDFKGKHFIGIHYKDGNELIPWREKDNFKTEDYGAVVYDNDKHDILKRVVNEKDYDIFDTGTVSDPFVAEDEYNEIVDYYMNEASLICDVSINTADEMTTVTSVDSAKARKIRDYVDSEGSLNNDCEYTKDAYLYFYSNDAMYYFSIHCMETSKGLAVDMNGKTAYVSEGDAEFLRSFYD